MVIFEQRAQGQDSGEIPFDIDGSCHERLAKTGFVTSSQGQDSPAVMQGEVESGTAIAQSERGLVRQTETEAGEAVSALGQGLVSLLELPQQRVRWPQQPPVEECGGGRG